MIKKSKIMIAAIFYRYVQICTCNHYHFVSDYILCGLKKYKLSIYDNIYL